MPWVVDVRNRRRQPEVMDQPGLDPRPHAGALRALERINLVSRSASILWPALRDLARERRGRRLEVLDIATGAGDIPVTLWRKARRAGFDLRLDACDRSAVALDHARDKARRAGADIHLFAWDALGGPLPREYDAVVCSLFLHHLDANEAVEVLRRMAASARHLVLVNDLNRSTAGWFLAWAGTRLLSTSAVAHTDGPRSVEGALTPAEALDLAERAGLDGATVRRRWPCRWLLTWRRPEGRAA